MTAAVDVECGCPGCTGPALDVDPVTQHGDPAGARWARRFLAVVGADPHVDDARGAQHQAWLRLGDQRWVHVYASGHPDPARASWWVVVRDGVGRRVGERAGPLRSIADACAVRDDRIAALRALVDVAPEAFALPSTVHPPYPRTRRKFPHRDDRRG